MTSTRPTLIALGSLALLSACGAGTPAPARAMYSAEELNAFALPPPPEEVAGASDPNALPPPALPETPAPPASAHVRVIHASPDPAAASVAVYLDDAQTPAVATLAFKAAAGYADVPAGAHTVQVRPASAAATSAPVLAGPTPALDAGASYTVIAHGVVGTPALALTAAPDASPVPDDGHAHLRFFHAVVGLGAVDVCAAGATAAAPATALFTNVAYGAFAHTTGPGEAYLSVATAAPTVAQLRVHSPVACRGRVLGHVPLALAEHAVSTVVAVGRAASVGHPAVANELMLCTDAPGATTTACTVERVRPGALPPAARPAAPAAPAAHPAAPAAPAAH